MNRSHPESQAISAGELDKKTAVHEAGHAAAIYLSNRQKQLPPVAFQIVIKQGDPAMPGIARVEGGNLIQASHFFGETASANFPTPQRHAYQQAFETDIINLLVGPLAEANYVAQRDDEPISPCLVNLNALPAYGGASDLKIVHDYLEFFITVTEQREKKLAELFLTAFNFINHWPNWFAITALANYILSHNKQLIEYEEIAEVLERHYLIATKRLAYRPRTNLQLAHITKYHTIQR